MGQFHLTSSEWETLNNTAGTGVNGNVILETIVSDRNLPVYLAGPDGGIRICNICALIKPDRAHHCSACGL
ncbi:unnamed protein product [Trichobilharzia regenti]|nr:unnamed protein product [Trichobilharzia regenti]